MNFVHAASEEFFLGFFGSDFGTEKCGREIDDNDIKFFRVGL